MLRGFFIIAFVFSLFSAAALTASAQPPLENDNRRPRTGQEDLPKNIKETLAKQRIEREKKEYDDLLKRTEEAVRISEELEDSFAKSNTLTDEDSKKVEKLEKLIKKIRSDLGGDGEPAGDGETEEPEEKPDSLITAFKSLQSNATKLFDEVKKSTRHTISAVAIRSSNTLLKVLKFIRIGN